MSNAHFVTLNKLLTYYHQLPQKPIGLSSQCASQLNCPRQTIIEVRARRQSNNLSGPSIMDVPRWDSLRLAPNIPAKRSWDGDASPSSCLSSVPRFRERQESVHRDILEGQNHKIRRTADTSSLHIGWNTSPETKAWIVQQNAIGAGSGVEENDSVEGRRADSLDAPGTSDHNNAPQLPPLTIWSRHNDESNRPRFQQASGPSSADVGNSKTGKSAGKFEILMLYNRYGMLKHSKIPEIFTCSGCRRTSIARSSTYQASKALHYRTKLREVHLA